MNSGILQFSLGLTAGSFLSMMDRARDKTGGLVRDGLRLPGLGAAIGGVVASLSSFEAVIEGVFDAINRGAELERLSRRTGESVASLFELQKGFKMIGLSAEEVGPMIFRMQKALGGVNEFGEDTRNVFYRMGLDIDALKKKNAAEQFRLIGQALGKLNSSGAANAAATIFGREGAGSMVELSRSTQEFSEAMEKATHDAEIFQRNAMSFDRLERGLTEIKEKAETLFAGIAEGAAPAIQAVIDMINKVDLSGVGQQIGHIITIVTEAFREGSLIQLIALSIKTGFEIGFAYLPALLEKLGGSLLHLFEQPLIYVQATLTWMELKIMELVGKVEAEIQRLTGALKPGGAVSTAVGKVSPTAGVALQVGGALLDKVTGGYQGSVVQGMMAGGGAPSFSDVLKDRENEGVSFGGLTPDSQFGLGDIDADADARMKAAGDAMKGILAPLKAMTDGLLARAPKPMGGEINKNNGGQGLDLLPTKGEYKPEFTDFEKMGFVLGGASNPLLEATKRQTYSTDRLTNVMMRAADALTKTMMNNAAAFNQL